MLDIYSINQNEFDRLTDFCLEFVYSYNEGIDLIPPEDRVAYLRAKELIEQADFISYSIDNLDEQSLDFLLSNFPELTDEQADNYISCLIMAKKDGIYRDVARVIISVDYQNQSEICIEFIQ